MWFNGVMKGFTTPQLLKATADGTKEAGPVFGAPVGQGAAPGGGRLVARVPTEQEAWRRLAALPARKRYEHAKTWSKKVRRRRNLAKRIQRDASGCWVWTGQTTTRKGRVYALFSYRTPAPENKRVVTRSAFGSLIDEWFPELQAMARRRTSPRITCDPLCVNPLHRVDKSVTRQTLTADQVIEIYRSRGEVAKDDLAKRFGVSREQVASIWNGRNWARVTGATPHRPTRRVTSPEVIHKILELKGCGRSSRDVAAEFDVGYKVVLAVWNGTRSIPNLPQKQSA